MILSFCFFCRKNLLMDMRFQSKSSRYREGNILLKKQRYTLHLPEWRKTVILNPSVEMKVVGKGVPTTELQTKGKSIIGKNVKNGQ